MSGGYRRVILAVVGIAIILGFAIELFLWLNPEQIPIRSGGTVESVQESEPAGGSECEPAWLERATGPKGLRKRESCAKAAVGQQDHRNEFILARANADAANASAAYAFDQARVAAIGGVLGLVTMIAAIGAAIYAGLAAHHTKRSANISHDSQRPWVAISCHIAKFSKSEAGIEMAANVSFHNTGAIAAVSYYSSNNIEFFKFSEMNEVRDKLTNIWKQFRENNPRSNRVLIPSEMSTQRQRLWKALDFSEEQLSENEKLYMLKSQKSYCVVIAASAYYKIPGSDDWHATERSFIVTIDREPDFILNEWIDGGIPDQQFSKEDITARPFISGETS